MELAGPLKTEINLGKYTNTYGAYQHCKVPRKNLMTVRENDLTIGRKSLPSTKRQKKPLEHGLLQKSRFRSHNAYHSMATCDLCQPFTDSRALDEEFSLQCNSENEPQSITVKMSIPSHSHYKDVKEVVECLNKREMPQPEANTEQELGAEDRLATWIFTPSHGDR